MGHIEYRFERFIQPEFPVFASVQSGREVLVKIHYHVSSAEVIEVLEGKVQMLIGAAYRECQKGDIVFIPPSVVHEVISLTEDAAIRGISYEFSLVDIPGVEVNFSELFHRSQSMQYVISGQDEVHENLSTYISNIFSVYGNFSTGSKLHIVSYLLLIMSQLVQSFSLEIGTHDRNYKKLRPVLEYIEKHYTEKIQISELSEIIHVCDDRLIRLFKEVAGETPIEYIMKLRIENGIKLLSSTELSIADIAEQTGFGSDTYMTRVFKQKLNTTPGKYRHK